MTNNPDPAFWAFQPDPPPSMDAYDAIAGEEAGGIVAYVLPEYEDRVLDGLLQEFPKTYLVCWGGGYERTSYQSFTDYDKALATAKRWVQEAENSNECDGDFITLLTIKGDQILSTEDYFEDDVFGDDQ